MHFKVLSKKVFIEGFKNGKYSMENAPFRVLSNEAILSELLPYDRNNSIVDFAYPKVLRNLSFAEKLVKFYGPNFNKLSLNLRNNQNLALTAFQSTKGCLLNLGDKLNNYNFAETLIKIDPFAIRSFHGEVFENKDLNLLAVKGNGLVYRNLCYQNRQDDEIALEAVKNNGFVYHFLESSKKENLDLARIAIKTAKDYTELVYREMPTDVRADHQISIDACSYELRCLNHTPFQTVLNEDFKNELALIISNKREEIIESSATESSLIKFDNETEKLLSSNYQRALEEEKQALEMQNDEQGQFALDFSHE